MADNPVLGALEAFNRTHPHRQVDPDEVVAAARTLEDSEASGEPLPHLPPEDSAVTSPSAVASEQLPLAVASNLDSRARDVLMDWLTAAQIEEACDIGRRRLAAARRRNRSQPYGDPGDERRVAIDEGSCIAEYAVAIYLDLPWRSELIEDLSEKPPDVGDDIEVRWTAHAEGHLITHDSDHDARTFVLVRGKLPRMVLSGWAIGAETKTRSYQGHPHARSPLDYWMPSAHLEFMYRLREDVRGR